MTTGLMTKDLATAIRNRRTYYSISKQSPVSDQRLEQLVADTLKHVPSSFNSQSSRLVLLLGAQHDKLWDIVTMTLRKVVGDAEQLKSTEQKMASFKSGYGTVLFFEDQTVVQQLQTNFAAYAERFPVWSEQTSGMHQFALWVGLEAEGLGASLQHYNPLIDDEVRKTWNLPESWKLIAQMPFGAPTAEPGEKQFQPPEQRMKVFK